MYTDSTYMYYVIMYTDSTWLYLWIRVRAISQHSVPNRRGPAGPKTDSDCPSLDDLYSSSDLGELCCGIAQNLLNSQHPHPHPHPLYMHVCTSIIFIFIFILIDIGMYIRTYVRTSEIFLHCTGVAHSIRTTFTAGYSLTHQEQINLLTYVVCMHTYIQYEQ